MPSSNGSNRARLGRGIVLVAALCAASGGCATVKPWERGLLAKPEMQFVACPMLHGIDQHVYFSKEASTGGVGVAGGGCGCN
jgi:hypothetical protein